MPESPPGFSGAAQVVRFFSANRRPPEFMRPSATILQDDSTLSLFLGEGEIHLELVPKSCIFASETSSIPLSEAHVGKGQSKQMNHIGLIPYAGR
jgi:hypothetical protein